MCQNTVYIFGQFDKLDFLSILNLIFTACVACKNRVQTRKCRSIGGMSALHDKMQGSFSIATCSVHLILAQTSQEGFQCTTAEE